MALQHKTLNVDQARAVYQVLVDECGAQKNDPFGFIAEFTSADPCTEWRFQGSLGFGGKFRYPCLSVDCYAEDETPQRLKSIEDANRRLFVLKTSFSQR